MDVAHRLHRIEAFLSSAGYQASDLDAMKRVFREALPPEIGKPFYYYPTRQKEYVIFLWDNTRHDIVRDATYVDRDTTRFQLRICYSSLVYPEETFWDTFLVQWLEIPLVVPRDTVFAEDSFKKLVEGRLNEFLRPYKEALNEKEAFLTKVMRMSKRFTWLTKSRGPGYPFIMTEYPHCTVATPLQYKIFYGQTTTGMLSKTIHTILSPTLGYKVELSAQVYDVQREVLVPLTLELSYFIRLYAHNYDPSKKDPFHTKTYASLLEGGATMETLSLRDADVFDKTTNVKGLNYDNVVKTLFDDRPAVWDGLVQQLMQHIDASYRKLGVYWETAQIPILSSESYIRLGTDLVTKDMLVHSSPR